MKRVIPILFIVLSALVVNAQYTTPGTGVKWGLAELVEHSNGTVVWNVDQYEVTATLSISATDTLQILDDVTVVFHDLAGIESSGTLLINAPEQALFTALDSTSANKWRGIKLLADHVTHIKNVTFKFGGGIKASSGLLTVDGSTFYKGFYKSGSSNGSYASGAILDLTGEVYITNNSFLHNQRGAVTSGSNVSCRAVIKNNYMFGNTTENSNRPQINMGPAGANDTTFIIGNTIIGNGFVMSGGIAYSSLLGVPGSVVIDSNIVDKNRYGITLTGSPITGAIRHNIITDNDIQNAPSLGGSGINLTASSASAVQKVLVTGNVITGNLWGITIIGYPEVNMGNADPENFNPGGNIFANNGNEGVLYDLYNNGPVEQYAMYNCWGVDVQDSVSIEGVVVHQPDDDELGLVHFMPACKFQTFFTVKNWEGVPLSGVEISIEGEEENLVSDGLGAAWTMLSPGDYNFTASHEDYNLYEGTFTVEQGEKHVEVIFYTDPTYTVTFTVFDFDGEPVSNAEIAIESETLITNVNGMASIDLLDGEYSYTVTAVGFVPYEGTFTVAQDEVNLAIILSYQNYTVTFTVADPDNSPLSNAEISIASQTLTTNSEGIASIELPNGSYPYTAEADSHESANGTVDVNSDDVEVKVILIPINSVDVLSAGIHIYPNPVSDRLYIVGQSNISYEIISLIGKTVKRGNIQTNSIDVSILEPGIYLLRINWENGPTVQRFVKQR